MREIFPKSLLPMIGESMPVIPGYNILKFLGEGSHGKVYLATKDGKHFAIKTLKKEGSKKELEESIQFRQEAATIARINHPNIVRIHGIGEVNKTPYLIMEYVDHKTLGELIEGGPIPIAHFIKLAVSICEAVAEVHRFGLLHRDLKPQNIFVSSEMDAKLFDFGYAGESDSSTERKFVGTIHYAAPEQCGVLDRPVDARSDLYSLGVLFFEALTGRLPFRSDNVGEIVRMHASQAPELVHVVQPSVPEIWSKIISKLLNKDPDDRYLSAAGLLYDLQNSDKITTLGSTDYLNPVSEAPLIGRETNLSDMRKKWDDAKAAAKTCFIQIEGEGGLGKTRIARSFRVELENHGLIHLAGKCNFQEAMPLAPIREAMDQFIAAARRSKPELLDKITKAGQEYGGILKRLSKGMGLVFASAPELTPLAPAQEEERFYRSVAGFFHALAGESGGLVLQIEDIQWADEGTVKLCNYLAKTVAHAPVCVLTTSRNDSQSNKALSHFLVSVGESNVGRIILEPLKVQEVSRLVGYYLGSEKFPAAFADRLTKVTNGNPFVIGEYIRSLFSGASLWMEDGAWRYDESKLSQIALSSDVVSLLVQRLEQVDQTTRRILQFAGIIGNSFNLDILYACLDDSDNAGSTTNAVAFALNESVRSSLIERQDKDLYVFVHDRVREAVVATLPQDQKWRVHLKIFTALEKISAGTPESDFVLARHLNQCEGNEPPEKSFKYNASAGKLALQNGSVLHSMELLAKAIAASEKTAPASPEMLELLTSYGDAHVRSARFEESKPYYMRALEHSARGLEQGNLLFRLAVARFQTGDSPGAWLMLQDSFKALGQPFPKSQSLRSVIVGWYWFELKFMERMNLRFGSAKGKARERRELLAQIYEFGGQLANLNQDIDLYVQMMKLQYHSAHFLGAGRALAMSKITYASLEAHFGRVQSFRYHAQAAIDMARQVGEPALEMACRSWNHVSLDRAGELEECETYGRENAEMIMKYCDPYIATRVVTIASGAMADYGLPFKSIHWVQAHKDLLERVNNRSMVTSSYGIMASQLAMTGQVADSARTLNRVNELCSGQFANSWNLSFVHLYRLWSKFFMDDVEGIEDEIAGFLKHASGFNLKQRRMGFAWICHFRLKQMRSAGDRDRRKNLAQLAEAISAFKVRAYLKILKPHVHLLEAAHASEAGQVRRARRFFEKTRIALQESWSPAAEILYLTEFARYTRLIGDEQVGMWAGKAVSACRRFGWIAMAGQLEREFSGTLDLKEDKNTDLRLSSGDEGLNYVESLIRINVAAAESTESNAQTQAILDEVIQILNAERAFIFGVDEKTGKLVMVGGRDNQKSFIDSLANFSHTVVAKVAENRKPMILTGSDEAEAIGSASAIAFDLRSIMAAPLLVRDELVGIIYMDSRLAKGIFKTSDINFLGAIASSIAASIKTAQAIKLKMEKSDLQNELAIQAAVSESAKKVQDMVDNMQEAMFSVTRDGHIVAPVSRYAHSVFHEDVSGKPLLETLFRNFSRESEAYSHLTTALAAVYGEDELQWTLMSDYFPQNVNYITTDGVQKKLRTKAVPLWDSVGALDKIMFMVEDITELEVKARELNESRERNSIINEIAGCTVSQFEDLVGSSGAMLSEAEGKIAATDTPQSIPRIAGLLHKLKGNARLYRFLELSQFIHRKEDELLQIKSDWEQTKITREAACAGIQTILVDITTLVAKYREIEESTFKARVRQSNIPLEVLPPLIRALDFSEGKLPPEQVEQARRYLFQASGRSLFCLMADLSTFVSEFALTLNKRVELKFVGEDILLETEVKQLLSDAIVQILRNCMDHGIELPQEREAGGKSPTGTVSISWKQVNQRLVIETKDDGAGINVQKLIQKAKMLGVLSNENITSEQAMALVFAPQLSTRDEANSTSGRGVGLSAVKESIEDWGGQITVHSKSGQGTVFAIDIPFRKKLEAPKKIAA